MEVVLQHRVSLLLKTTNFFASTRSHKTCTLQYRTILARSLETCVCLASFCSLKFFSLIETCKICRRRQCISSVKSPYSSQEHLYYTTELNLFLLWLTLTIRQSRFRILTLHESFYFLKKTSFSPRKEKLFSFMVH